MSLNEGVRVSARRHAKVDIGTADLKQRPADHRDRPAKIDGATSSFSHVGEKEAGGLPRGPVQIGGTASSFSHVG